MAFPVEAFEGSWDVIVGDRNGSTLEVRKVNDHYQLLEGTEVLYADLVFDGVTFTLKNDQACLCLWKDGAHLFGVEDNGSGTYDSWGARGSQSVPHDPWRVGQPWIVKTAKGEPPFVLDDTVTILEEEVPQNYRLCRDTGTVDNLVSNLGNHTLDSLIRTVGLWQRDPADKDLIFGMVMEPAILARVREEFPNLGSADPRRVREIVAGFPGLLSFEVNLLTHSILNQEESIGVWGAEEGG